MKVDQATNPERIKIEKKENKSNQINFDQQSILQYLQMMTQLSDEGIFE